MPGGTIITNTAQSDPEGFKSSLDWNQEIPLENKVNDHQIKSRAREIYTRIKAGVKNADEADKILNQFSEQLDRSSGWFAKGCLRLTYSDDLRRDLVIKRKYGIQILWQDDRNHEFYVAMHALLEVKGVDKQVLDRIHQPGRATISQMRRIMQEVKQSEFFKNPDFQQATKNIEIFFKYQSAYKAIQDRIFEAKIILDSAQQSKGKLTPTAFIFIDMADKEKLKSFKNENFDIYYTKNQYKKQSIDSLHFDSLVKDKDPNAIHELKNESEELKNQIVALENRYVEWCQSVASHFDTAGPINEDILTKIEAQIDEAEKIQAEMQSIGKSIIPGFLMPYENLVEER